MISARRRVGLFGHRGLFARFVSSWLVPLMMTIAYVFMMLTADTDSSVDRATRVAWMSLGLAFVLVVWWIFKLLVQYAAFARAAARTRAPARTSSASRASSGAAASSPSAARTRSDASRASRSSE